jgi:hypothetical protein
MSGRWCDSPKSRSIRAARALGGVRAAERAEQLRARGVDPVRVAEVLGVSLAALDAYYALQDETAAA